MDRHVFVSSSKQKTRPIFWPCPILPPDVPYTNSARHFLVEIEKACNRFRIGISSLLHGFVMGSVRRRGACSTNMALVVRSANSEGTPSEQVGESSWPWWVNPAGPRHVLGGMCCLCCADRNSSNLLNRPSGATGTL